jgi:ribonuclease-3
MNFEVFEQSVEIEFINKDLLKQAFTHRSYLNEHRTLGIDHNERLEFLGDAVLELIVTRFLYEKFPDKKEGDLTAFRSALVNTNTLSEAATKIGMNAFLLLSKGEAKDTGRARQFILANTFEAYIGALYLDQGYDVAELFVSKHILVLIDDIVEQKKFIDSKSKFQELAQEHTGITPSYKLIKEVGPDHNKVFVIAVLINDKEIAEGEGKSKQEAEQMAAEKALAIKGW